MTRVVQVDADRPDPTAIADAAAIVRAGGLVAFPTETVYGLGAHALDAAAVARIFDAKGRPANDPVIVHVTDLAQAARVAAEIPEAAQQLAARFWPGPLTMILPKRSDVPALVTAGLATVGVRVPAHPVALALIGAAGVPIAAPSANRFSRPSPTCAQHVLDDLDGRVDLVLDAGATLVGVESTIVDLTVSPPVVRRPGGVSLQSLQQVLPSCQWGQTPYRDLRTVQNAGGEDAPQVAPGQLLRHYAPRATLTLYEGSPDAVVAALAADARRLAAAGQRVGLLAPEEDLMRLAPVIAAMATNGRIVTRAYGARRDPARAAHELFASLRALDAEGVDVMLASRPEDADLGHAIRDRLTRAAEGRIKKV